MTPQSQFTIKYDWGIRYLLVNYDMESLFREVKILRDTGTKLDTKLNIKDKTSKNISMI